MIFLMAFHIDKQTGSYFKFPVQNVNIAGSAYYQFGKANATTDLAA